MKKSSQNKSFRNDIKLITIGTTQSGKKAFTNRWTKNIFNEAEKATIVSEFGFKIVEIDGKLYRVQVWDLAGQDKNASITKIFAKDAHGVICVTNATDPNSLGEALQWKRSVDESKNFVDGHSLPCIIVDNNSDLLPEEEQFNDTHLKEFANDHQFDNAYRVSARTGRNVNESMDFLLRLIIKRLDDWEETNAIKEIIYKIVRKDQIKKQVKNNCV